MSIQKELKRIADPAKAKVLAGFFKTGPGQYSEGDVFLGITVPACREVAKKYSASSIQDIKTALQSVFHEERLVALMILVERFRGGDVKIKKNVFDFYQTQFKTVNNWDLVDSSAHQIAGEYLRIGPVSNKREKWARSKNLWIRRIAIVSTYADIRRGESHSAIKISEVLLGDTEDLMHKAVGWMLREVGKRCSEKELCHFLDKHVHRMPRTALRYAIERFPETKRKHYMSC